MFDHLPAGRWWDIGPYFRGRTCYDCFNWAPNFPPWKDFKLPKDNEHTCLGLMSGLSDHLTTSFPDQTCLGWESAGHTYDEVPNV